MPSAPGTAGTFGTLDPNRAIGRYGVAYVRKVCAHAHIGFDETSPDEDVLALDGQINFSATPVRVQIKTTTQWSLTSARGELLLPIQADWARKWRAQINPTFLIAVLLAKDIDSWSAYESSETRLGAYAL